MPEAESFTLACVPILKTVDVGAVSFQTAEDVFNLVKARSAMSETANLIMSTTKDLDGDPVCEVILGEEGDEGLIQLSSKGLMRLTFKTGKITSTYYMIRRAENVF